MGMETIITIISVAVGFVLFGATYAGYQYGKPKSVLIALFVAAIVCLTIIPTAIAIFIAA